MAKCGHVLEGFKKVEAWDFLECALCMLVLLKDLISKHSRGAALHCAVGIEEYRQELIETSAAIWRFNSSIACTSFGRIEHQEPSLSDSGDSLVHQLSDAVTHGIAILEDSVILIAKARAGIRVRHRHKASQSLVQEASDNLMEQTINAAALKETNERLKEHAERLRKVVAANPCLRLFEWLPVV